MRLPVLSAAVLTCAIPAAAQEAAPRLANAGFLQGCWAGEARGRVFEERWSAERGGTMIGTGRTVRGDSTVDVELVVLRARGDTLRYEAHPLGQEGAVFTTLAGTRAQLVFENPSHDFPQRIIYRAVGTDSLHARIEGSLNGTVRGVDFPMARVPCDPPASPR